MCGRCRITCRCARPWSSAAIGTDGRGWQRGGGVPRVRSRGAEAVFFHFLPRAPYGTTDSRFLRDLNLQCGPTVRNGPSFFHRGRSRDRAYPRPRAAPHPPRKAHRHRAPDTLR